jgi:sortase B
VEIQGDSEETETEESTEPEETDVLTALGITVPEKNLDWEELRQVNGEIYAWIYIPETSVDYPVLQSATDDEYYLEHNLDGSSGYPGCIFTQMLNGKDFQDYNTILYGHNMKDGTMFRTLHYYQNEEFFYNNPYIYVYTENGVLVYRIFAAYNAGDEHILNTYDFATEEGFASYLETVKGIAPENGYIQNEVEVTTQNHIITLSTCTDMSDERYLVQGVLINDEFDPNEEDTASDVTE